MTARVRPGPALNTEYLEGTGEPVAHARAPAQ